MNTLFPSNSLGIRHPIWEHSGNLHQFPKWCALWVSEVPSLLPRYVWPPIPLWSKCSSFWVDMWASRLPYQCGRLRLDGGVGRGISRQSRSTPLFLLNNGFQKSNPSLCQKKLLQKDHFTQYTIKMKSSINSLLFPGQIFVSDTFWQWWWNQSIWSRSCCWSSWCVILQLELVLNRTLHLLEGLYFSVSMSLPTFSLFIIWCTSFWAPTFSLPRVAPSRILAHYVIPMPFQQC